MGSYPDNRSVATFDRIGRIGDGWLNIYGGPNKVQAALDRIHASAEKVGRDPSEIGLDCWTGVGKGTPDDWRNVIETWRDHGATHITFNTIFGGGVDSRDAADHLKAIEAYITAVGDLF